MDKSVKLQRYDRKDYTELVDFPVEIVGRDGVVRRYTFEDSIRLYQRRITFAPIRYQYDGDLVRAEVNHCRSRIDQLRRSYFHRYGWGTPEGQISAEDAFGDLAGELAAFICRVLGVEGRPEIRFDEVREVRSIASRALAPSAPPPEGVGTGADALGADAQGTEPAPAPCGEGASTWYLTRGGVDSGGMLLYFYRFDGSGADAIRDRFFATIKEFERIGRAGGDAERLLAFHHNVDCGFVLSGRGGDHPSFVAKDDLSQQVDLAPTPWDEVIEIIRKGDYDSALRRCRELVRDQPWHRNAYVAGAMLAAYLGEHSQGEDLALVGSRYFPKDGSVLYYLGLCRLRLGRPAEAERALREAVEVAPDLVSARALLATHLVQIARYGEAVKLLQAREGIVPDDRRADADLASLEQGIMWRASGLYGGIILSIGGLVASTLIGKYGLIALLLGIACAGLGWLAFHRQLDSVIARQRFEEISQGLRRLHRRSRHQPPVS
jgi:tetratricopeptide (TPR) repeat protein